jgi:hypothetical protein
VDRLARECLSQASKYLFFYRISRSVLVYQTVFVNFWIFLCKIELIIFCLMKSVCDTECVFALPHFICTTSEFMGFLKHHFSPIIMFNPRSEGGVECYIIVR